MSYLFYPLLFLIGVENVDNLTMGRLVGLKTMTNPVIGYAELAKLIRNSHTFESYIDIHGTNGTYETLGNHDVILHATNTTLIGGVLTVGYLYYLHS